MSINIKKSIKVGLAVKDISQTELAELSGIPQPSISYLMKQGSCSFESLNKLSAAFDLKVSEFIAWGES